MKHVPKPSSSAFHLICGRSSARLVLGPSQHLQNTLGVQVSYVPAGVPLHLFPHLSSRHAVVRLSSASLPAGGLATAAWLVDWHRCGDWDDCNVLVMNDALPRREATPATGDF